MSLRADAGSPQQRSQSVGLHAVFSDPVGGTLAVIGMLYQIGNPNAFLANFTELPRKEGTSVVGDRLIDLTQGLTSTIDYHSYAGSLTTPPCSEIVTWIVLKEVQQASEEQIQAFRQIMGNNFRPTQSDRVVFKTGR